MNLCPCYYYVWCPLFDETRDSAAPFKLAPTQSHEYAAELYVDDILCDGNYGIDELIVYVQCENDDKVYAVDVDIDYSPSVMTYDPIEVDPVTLKEK